MDVFEIYARLWNRAQGERVWVHYFEWPSDGRAGYFDAHSRNDEAEQTEIGIFRIGVDDDSTTPSRHRGPEGTHLPPPDLEYELITLAHEYGHHRSHCGGTSRPEWERYDAVAHRRTEIVDAVNEAMPDGLSPEQQNERTRTALYGGLDDDARARIVNEEALAWTIGREVLADLGMTDFTKYDERRRTGLHHHRYRLGMEDAWPDDV